MEIQPCKTSTARIVDRRLLEPPERGADGASVFKLYYISIEGREGPERYEWSKSPLDRGRIEAGLAALRLEGVGFFTLFPHITKCFRFAPEMETVLHVRAYNTADLSPLDLSRQGGWIEFACYAEAVLAADEYRAWAEASSVAEYLSFLSPATDAPVLSHTKLAEWCGEAE